MPNLNELLASPFFWGGILVGYLFMRVWLVNSWDYDEGYDEHDEDDE